MSRFVALLMVAQAVGVSQVPAGVAAARSWTAGHQKEVLGEFSRMLAIPNVASDAAAMRRNASFLTEAFARRGVSLRMLEVPGAPPALFGEKRTPGAAATIVLYAHYDGQPVVPAKWTNGEPFQPQIRDARGTVIGFDWSGLFDPEWRLYARSASDDKGPIQAMLAALDALEAARVPLTANVKFFFDGEEEAGSPHLPAILAKYGSLLSSDTWIFCDGPVHQSRRPQIVFGARGNTGLELTVYGPNRELHSGHYGNWALNPALMLAQLLASMKDEDGRVRIEGFYDDVEPLSAAEKEALAALPDMEAELKREFGLGGTENPGKRLEELITLPALNVQGLSSGGTGAEARNVVPSTAVANLGVRLVKGMDPGKTREQIIAHIRRQGYLVVESEPDAETRLRHPRICGVRRRAASDGQRAVRVAMDSAIARRVIAAVESAHGPALKLPTLGGTLPVAAIEDAMRAPVIIVPTVNHDNNQHSHDENIRLRNLWDAVATMAALMTME
ncbi:MAG: M20/M25/M40 family metallo-hydrolase [Bryobacterales bacterium]|nr:M20/M25/M40 family metallo-hydrolase [Bryobacterales bacterium]